MASSLRKRATPTAWRLVAQRWARSALDGEGARRAGGRWNARGTPIVYTAGSLALAALELLVHTEDEALLQSYVAIPIWFPDTLLESIDQPPPDWRTNPIPPSTQSVGSRWAASETSPILQVPSVVVTVESNFLINPAHPKFSSIDIGPPQPFDLDQRLVQ